MMSTTEASSWPKALIFTEALITSGSLPVLASKLKMFELDVVVPRRTSYAPHPDLLSDALRRAVVRLDDRVQNRNIKPLESSSEQSMSHLCRNATAPMAPRDMPSDLDVVAEPRFLSSRHN